MERCLEEIERGNTRESKRYLGLAARFVLYIPTDEWKAFVEEFAEKFNHCCELLKKKRGIG